MTSRTPQVRKHFSYKPIGARGQTMRRMKRDLPQHVAPHAGADDDRPRSLLASRAFWIGGLLSVAVWAGVIYLVYLAAS